MKNIFYFICFSFSLSLSAQNAKNYLKIGTQFGDGFIVGNDYLNFGIGIEYERNLFGRLYFNTSLSTYKASLKYEWQSSPQQVSFSKHSERVILWDADVSFAFVKRKKAYLTLGYGKSFVSGKYNYDTNSSSGFLKNPLNDLYYSDVVHNIIFSQNYALNKHYYLGIKTIFRTTGETRKPLLIENGDVILAMQHNASCLLSIGYRF